MARATTKVREAVPELYTAKPSRQRHLLAGVTIRTHALPAHEAALLRETPASLRPRVSIREPKMPWSDRDEDPDPPSPRQRLLSPRNPLPLPTPLPATLSPRLAAVRGSLPVDVFGRVDDPGILAAGTRAHSPYLAHDGSVKLAVCDVLGYDAADGLYQVQWLEGGGTKRVARFQLRLAGEEPGGCHAKHWEASKLEARLRRDEAEAELIRSALLATANADALTVTIAGREEQNVANGTAAAPPVAAPATAPAAVQLDPLLSLARLRRMTARYAPSAPLGSVQSGSNLAQSGSNLAPFGSAPSGSESTTSAGESAKPDNESATATYESVRDAYERVLRQVIASLIAC